MFLLSYGLTDIGSKRLHNEDSFAISENNNLFVIADGMGGHAAGQVASQIAVETALRYIESNPLDSNIEFTLKEAFIQANKNIVDAGKEKASYQGMGTTLSCLLLNEHQGFIAHAGDSRIYRFRSNRLEQLTEDHTLVNDQVKKGLMSADEARVSRFRHILLNGIGIESEVLIETKSFELEPGDIFLLCTDGLTNMVHDNEIKQIIAEFPLEDIPKKLIDKALENGGDDNITAIILQINTNR